MADAFTIPQPLARLLGSRDVPDRLVRVPDAWSPRERLEAALWLARLDARTPAVERLVRLCEPFADATARARAAMLAVQALPYVHDPPGEWLARGAYTAAWGGDCLRLAPLVVAVAECAGVPGEVLWLTQPSAMQDHVTARLCPAGVWRWAETTIRGAHLGESPYAAADRLRDRGGL